MSTFWTKTTIIRKDRTILCRLFLAQKSEQPLFYRGMSSNVRKRTCHENSMSPKVSWRTCHYI